MPWYWILIILSAIFGPFEAMHALNKARRNREDAAKRKQAEQEKDEGSSPGTGKQTEAPEDEA